MAPKGRSSLSVSFSRPFPQVGSWMHFGRPLVYLWTPFGSPSCFLVPSWLPQATELALKRGKNQHLADLREFVCETHVILAREREERGPETVNRGGGQVGTRGAQTLRFPTFYASPRAPLECFALLRKKGTLAAVLCVLRNQGPPWRPVRTNLPFLF